LPAAPNQDLLNLRQAILRDDSEVIHSLLGQLSTSLGFLTLLNQGIIAALEEAGDTYGRGETFLPQLLLTAEGARRAFDYLRQALPAEAPEARETVVLGAVAGDIHDIGKNIVKALLESYGYQVVDLGKSVPGGEFLAAVKTHRAKVLGLSALMTTTMTEMKPVIQAVRQEGLSIKILVGGAVLTKDYADSIGADAYVKDAAEIHGIIRRLLDE
jgi:5-methyltetrahydrofolate--homocysteine methyltransferase